MSESEKERLNRNLDQLLQELRIVLPGVQVLFAFLLAVPFSARFGDVDDFERDIYFVALLLGHRRCAADGTVDSAPDPFATIERYLIALGSALTIAGMTALALAIVLSIVLVAHFLFGSAPHGARADRLLRVRADLAHRGRRLVRSERRSRADRPRRPLTPPGYRDRGRAPMH